MTGHVSVTYFQIRCFIHSVYPKFHDSISEPNRPPLGKLTHPNGLFGWKLPSDQVQPEHPANGKCKHMAEGEEQICSHIMSSVTNGALAGPKILIVFAHGGWPLGQNGNNRS